MRERSRVYVPPAWYPLGATRYYESLRPPVGELIARDRAVWRVLAVEDVPLDERDAAGLAEWQKRHRDPWPKMPFTVAVQWVGGVEPDWLKRAKSGKADMVVHSYDRCPMWQVYPHGRWPKCSCCGEPMPCRAELADLRVDSAMERMEEMAARLPGCCWGCGEPVTRRHKTVRYAGDNLDLPGGPGVVFHIRASCHHLAVKYEVKWLAADRSRRRILTWPSCRGTLTWYPDGSNVCEGGEPDCRGWETHNHASQSWLRGARCRMPRRPDYRDPDLPQGCPDGTPPGLIRLDGTDTGDSVDDGRPLCPGDLLVHQDGTSECIAGGLDDCWGGDRYRHARRRDCRSQSHGCPKCETTEGLA